MRAACIALFVLQMAPARAQPADGAREHFGRGNLAFDAGDYDRAADEFKQAYALSLRPQLLFNLAQAYRYGKDYEAALSAYERYLALEPNASNRDDVERFMARIREAMTEEGERPRPVEVTPPVVTPQVVAAPPPPPVAERFTRSRRGQLTLGLSALAGGLLLVGVVTGPLSLVERKSYDAGCDRGACDASAFDRGRRLAVTTDVMVALGVAAAAAAVIVAFIKPRRARPVTLGMAF